MAKYLACICEGGAEHAILDLLLDNHSLVFEREDLIEEEVLNRNFLSLGITLLFHIHKGIIGCRQALDFLAFRYFL